MSLEPSRTTRVIEMIYDARGSCDFSDRKIMFDTNVWIAIDGNDPRSHAAHYSNYYSKVLRSGNRIVVNDYIIGEYFNRACRIQYDIQYEDDPGKKFFKSRRKNFEFRGFIDSVRDTCLNILDDCVYEPAVRGSGSISDYIVEAGTGEIDFSDVVIREHCLANGYVLVSDDADFANCGLDFVTANPRLLRMGG